MKTIDLANFEITAEPTDLDENQFVSIWNIAASTTGRDANLARMLASKFLSFLCKNRCGFLVVSPTDAKYLDEWFERDNSLLYDWSPESDKIDVVAQHAQVPFDAFVSFLRDKKFTAEQNYNPRRADRVAWFTDDWNIG